MNLSGGFQFGAGGAPDLTKGLPAANAGLPFNVSSAPTTHVSFGLGSNANQPASSANSLLGSLLAPPPGQASQPTFGFGTTAAPQSSFGFNANTSSAGVGFGTSSAAQPAFGLGGGLNLGMTTTSSLLSTPSSVAQPTFGLGGALNPASTMTTINSTFGSFAQPTSTVNLGFGSSSTAPVSTTATAPLFGLTTTSTTTSLGLGFGNNTLAGNLFKPPSNSSGLFTASAAQALTSQPQSRGLGGTNQSSLLTTGQGTVGKPSDCKEQQVHSAIKESVTEFKKFFKQEREVREEISRMSSRPLFKVHEEMASLCQTFTAVTSELQRNARAITRLKQDTSQTLRCAEMALQTKDIPPGLQFENTAPTLYLMRLVDEFMSQMVLYRKQIDDLEGHLSRVGSSNSFSSQELSQLLRRLHESFLIVAANLQSVHEAVKNQKELYLNYRQSYLGDTADIFAKWRKAKAQNMPSIISRISGPTPFDTGNREINTHHLLQPTAVTGSSTSSFWSSTYQSDHLAGLNLMTGSSSLGQSVFSSRGQSASLLGSMLQASPENNALNLSQANGFQLQKPPTGSKRGKKA